MTAPDGTPAPRRRTGIARASAILVSLTAVSQVLGFVRDAVIASVFGAGASLDAYLVAQGVMNLAFALVAIAAARAVVPPVSRAVAADDAGTAERTAQTVLTGVAAVVLALAVVLFAAADGVVRVLAPGFDAATRELAVTLTRIVLAASVFVALTDVLAAVAQAHGRFALSGLQGIAFNVVMIAAAAWLGAEYGIEALAWGFVAGSALRMLVQLPALRAERLRLRPRLALRDEGVREALRLMPPLLVGSAVVNVNTLVDRAVGSAQGEGVITALSFGWRVVTLVDVLLVATVIAALYPAFSAVEADRAALRRLVDRSVRGMLVVLVPAVAVLALAARPLVELLFGRGDFDAEAVDMTATAVAVYAVSAAALALRSLASRACLAVGDGRTPVLVALGAMAVNVVGDLTLGVAYGIPGLAASTSLSLVAAAAALHVLLARRHAGATPGVLLAAVLRLGAAAGAGALVALAVGTPGLPPLAAVPATAAVVGAVYAGALLLLRSPELREVVAVVSSRLPRRGRTSSS